MTARTHTHPLPANQPITWPVARYFAKVVAAIGMVFDVWAEAKKQATIAQERYPFAVE